MQPPRCSSRWLNSHCYHSGFVSSSLSNSVNLQYLSMRLKHSLCEGMLFCQIFYYRWKHCQLLLKSLPNDDSEGAPLLTEGGARHLSARNLIIRYTAALAFVCTVGMNNHEQASGPMSKQMGEYSRMDQCFPFCV